MDGHNPNLLNTNLQMYILQVIELNGSEKVPIEAIKAPQGIANETIMYNIRCLEDKGFIVRSPVNYIGSNVLKSGTVRFSLTQTGRNCLLRSR